MTLKVLELHHHAIRAGATAAETDAGRDFYCDVLGLAVDPARARFAIPGYWLDVGDHAQLHLIGFEGPFDADPIDPTRPHVALGVTDVGAARTELAARGVPHRVLEGRGGPTTMQLFVRDPAGNVVELHQVGTCRCTPRSRVEEPVAYARVSGAVMFADMRGFTGLAERLAPDAVVPLLNEYFTVLTGITDQYGGIVYHMAGDGLMAGFGVPAPDASQPPCAPDAAASQAVEAAREMLSRFGELARRWKRALDVDTGLGIGINAGEVIAGNVGPAAHRSYTLIGDTVNVAARLSQRARAGEALFSRVVKHSLDALGRGGARALPLPSLQLRGRASPVEIWCLPAEERVDFRPAGATAEPLAV